MRQAWVLGQKSVPTTTLNSDSVPFRNVFWLFFLIAATAAFLRPSISWAEPTSPPITSSPSSDSIDPSSLSIHRSRPGMSRKQIESLTGPPLGRHGGAILYGFATSETPEKPWISVSYARDETAVAVEGCDLRKSGTLLLCDIISPEEIKAKLGEPTYEVQEAITAPTILRYEDLKLTIAWWNMRNDQDPNRKVFAIILEDEGPLPHP